MMAHWLGQWSATPKIPARLASRQWLRWLAIPVAIWLVVGLSYLAHQHEWLGVAPLEGLVFEPRPRMNLTILPPLPPRRACKGPRGRLLDDSPDDALRYESAGEDYPVPFFGSHSELSLGQTWMTPDGRYGPYGYGEEHDEYNRTKVDWDGVDWGRLQDECVDNNRERLSPRRVPSSQYGKQPRFTFLNESQFHPTPEWGTYPPTRRTALVLRSYEDFHYKEENMHMIRALIAEASLRSGGEYAVVLLVHVQNRDWNVHYSQENYYKALESMNIPPELRSITVLWDEHLLESWYHKTEEHRPMFQINQPLQLFALHYPEFDHYWQLELDQRFMGDSLEYLESLSAFARNEPRKQALERATYPYNPELYQSYDDLRRQVDEANNGSSRAWGPLRISAVQPIGPVPPVKNPEDEDFTWGVGEDADFIATNFCADVRTSSWVFGGFLEGEFKKGHDTPRWFCPPAIFRASRTVLHEAHRGQFEYGIGLPSESKMPTWALWLGLKISYPPQPVYMHAYDEERSKNRPANENDETSWNEEDWRNPEKRPFFGDVPSKSKDGLSLADPQSFADRGLSYWWQSNWPRKIMDVWLKNETEASDMPAILRTKDGKVLVPNIALHPVKT